MERCILLVLSSILFFLNRGDCVLLHTKQGSLNGETLISRGGRIFSAFYGIPYAEPPVGNLRFKVSSRMTLNSLSTFIYRQKNSLW